jgi:hypothetical protein
MNLTQQKLDHKCTGMKKMDGKDNKRTNFWKLDFNVLPTNILLPENIVI